MKKKTNYFNIFKTIIFGLLCIFIGILIRNNIELNNNSNNNNIESKNIEKKVDNNNKIEEENETESESEINNNKKNEENNSFNNKIIVIDPGHQIKGNSELEPIGPGASETKAKVTTGATGVETGQTEYELNLKVALLLQKKLQNKGYIVIMTRTTNEVNLSNKERAEIANNANADIFIRIHANSSDNKSAKGILTLCQTSDNKYNGYLSEQSCELSKLVLDKIVEKTGGINKGITKTDTMSGINWSKVPTTIIEMGFLSNPEEDKLLSTPDYQEKIAGGIVDGIEDFFQE